jgi:hypothetical protein
VWSYNIEAEEWELQVVTAPSERDYEGDIITLTLDTDDGSTETIEATGNHPFWVVSGDDLNNRPEVCELPGPEAEPTPSGRWTEARWLRLGDVFLTATGRSATVSGLTVRMERTKVYNLSVRRQHNYAVGESGVLVHNANCGGKPSGSYTVTFKSGKRYHGKGPESRARRSGRRIARRYDDPVVDTHWTPAEGRRPAFIDEARRILYDGGVQNPMNYNKINSPGLKWLIELLPG